MAGPGWPQVGLGPVSPGQNGPPQSTVFPLLRNLVAKHQVGMCGVTPHTLGLGPLHFVFGGLWVQPGPFCLMLLTLDVVAVFGC